MMPASYGGDPPPLSGMEIGVSTRASIGGATGASSAPPPLSIGVVASATGGLEPASVPAAPLSLGGGGVVASDPMPPEPPDPLVTLDPPAPVAFPVGGAASEHAPAQASHPISAVIECARIVGSTQ
jgi:hypothetical protein